MFRTRNDRRLEARAASGNQLALTITSSESFEIVWGDGTVDVVASGVRQSHTYSREYHGPVIIRPVDKTSVDVTFTEWTLEGNFDWVDVASFPVEATSIVVKDAYRLRHEAEWAPTNLSNVYMASTRGMLPGDVDRLIQALEDRIQNNGTLLVQGTPRKSNPQLETLKGASRNWAAEVIPAICLQVTTALTPFTRIVDGIARWVRGQRNGTPRQLEPGRCASFNNLDEVVTCGNSVLGHVDQTITARVRINGAQSGGYIFSTRDAATGGSISMYLTSGFLFTATFGYGGTHTTVIAPADKWIDLAITYSAATQTATFYIDGVEVGTTYNDNVGSNTMTAGLPILLGCRIGGAGQHFFGGEIAEVRQYDYILSEENLLEIAAMDWTKPEDKIGPRDPLIWYKLDEESTIVRNSGSLTINEATFGSGDSYVDLGTTLVGASDDFDISVDFYVSVDNGNGEASLVSQYTSGTPGRFFINTDTTDDSIRVFINASSNVDMITPAAVFTRDEWQTVRLTRVGDLFSLYVNGSLAMSATQADVSIQQRSTMLGNDFVSYDEFNGVLRNVVITSGGTTTRMLTNTEPLPITAALTNVTVEPSRAGDGVVTASNITSFRNKSGTNSVFSYQNSVGFSKQNLLEGTREFTSDATDHIDRYGFRSTGHYWSFEGWFKSTKTTASYLYDVTSPRRVFAWVGTVNANRLAFFHGSNWIDFGADSTPSDGEWHHVAFVVNGDEASCYVDGSQVGTTQAVVSGALGDWNRSRLGSDYSTGSANQFEGSMRDVTLWDYALSAGEVARRFNGIEPLGKRITINVPRNESNPDFDVDGNPLTYQGQAPIEPTIETPCLTTDGAGDYVDTGVTLDGATEFTIFRRAKYLSTTGYDLDGCGTLGAGSILFGRDSGNNKIFLSAGDDGSSVVLDDTIADDVVHSLAVTTKVGGNRSIYLDGEAISTATAASDTFTSPISNTANFMIGARNKSGASHWVHAEYYEYYIYDRQLSDDEILYLHTFGQQGEDPSNDGLVLCYSFGDGKSPIKDRSGQKNDGYLTSANHAAAWAGRQSLYNPYVTGFFDFFGSTMPTEIGSNKDVLLGIDVSAAAGQFARYQAWAFDCHEPNSPFAVNCSEGRTFVKYGFTGDSGDHKMFASGALAGPFTAEVPTVVDIYEDTLSVELASEVAKVY